MPRRPIGVSLHFGATVLERSHYCPWAGTCPSAEVDALHMMTLAESRGFTPKLFTGTGATSEQLRAELTDAGDRLLSGDLLLLSYSGHGGAVIDLDYASRIAYANTWAMYDRMFISDEFDELWGRFKTGVRIVVVSDSCFSGSIVSGQFPVLKPLPHTSTRGSGKHASRQIPPDIVLEVYRRNRTLYDRLQRGSQRFQRPPKAGVLLLAACRGNGEAHNFFGLEGGIFTNELLRALRGPATDYRTLMKKVRKFVVNVEPSQKPQLTIDGHRDAAIEHELPFTIVRSIPAG